MNIVWIYPQTAHCGIAMYGDNYVAALKKRATIEVVSPDDILRSDAQSLYAISIADIIHLQYETSFFVKGHRDNYPALLARIRRPIFVSLHEVYKSHPDVFPRENLHGNIVTLMVRRWLYDFRHPVQRFFARHCFAHFGASHLLVHGDHHKEILGRLGITQIPVIVLPHPVRISPVARVVKQITDGPISIASSGFITNHFNYDLLFTALKELRRPWRFIWIGGARRHEDKSIEQSIQSRIAVEGWDERFTITGWVDQEKRDTLLSEADLYLAFFTARSSSGSLCTAIGSGVPIVATDLPLMREINGVIPFLTIVPSDPMAVATAIERLAADPACRSRISDQSAQYARDHSFETMADRMLRIYNGETP